MSQDLDKVREIFLSQDLDEEDRADNEKTLAEWENTLRVNEAFVEWQEADITIQIASKARETYKELGLLLAIDGRTLTEPQRQVIFAKQDAMLWFLAMVSKDAKQEITKINNEISLAIATL